MPYISQSICWNQLSCTSHLITNLMDTMMTTMDITEIIKLLMSTRRPMVLGKAINTCSMKVHTIHTTLMKNMMHTTLLMTYTMHKHTMNMTYITLFMKTQKLIFILSHMMHTTLMHYMMHITLLMTFMMLIILTMWVMMCTQMLTIQLNITPLTTMILIIQSTITPLTTQMLITQLSIIQIPIWSIIMLHHIQHTKLLITTLP